MIMRERFFVLIALIFLLLWTISEWEERIDRSVWQDRLQQFMDGSGKGKGNRFTAEDGRKLEERIDSVERKCEERRECEH